LKEYRKYEKRRKKGKKKKEMNIDVEMTRKRNGERAEMREKGNEMRERVRKDLRKY